MPKLFLMNVPHDCIEQELRDWFTSNEITAGSVRLIRDLTGWVSPCFAYVDLQENAKVNEAIEKLNGKELRGRVLLVSQARRVPPAS